MISVTKLRNGITFEEQGEPFRVVKYTHTHISRGSGTIKVQAKQLRTGRLVQKTYKGNDKVEEIQVIRKPMQYLYHDGEAYLFMDPDTYEQVEIQEGVLGEESAYLKEGGVVQVLWWEDEALTIDLPAKMVFEISEAAPGEKGDSASNVYKDAVLENGLRVRVPLFIKPGEKVRIDTRTGEYIERVNE